MFVRDGVENNGLEYDVVGREYDVGRENDGVDGRENDELDVREPHALPPNDPPVR